MTNSEMKSILVKSGLTEADAEKTTEKFDAEKISDIIDAAHSPEEAFKNLHDFYPELEVDKLQEQCDFIQAQFESAINGNNEKATFELSEKELDMVSGGGFVDWFKRNWKQVVTGAVLTVVGGIVTTVGVVTGNPLAITLGVVAASAGACVLLDSAPLPGSGK